MIHNALLKAEENAINNPTLAINRYHQYLSLIDKLPDSIQLRWHTAAIRAALNSAQFEFAEAIFKDMKLSYNKAGFNNKDFILIYLGSGFAKMAFLNKRSKHINALLKQQKILLSS